MRSTYSRRLPSVLVVLMTLLLIPAAVVFADEGAVPKREDIAEQYKWDLSALYPTDEAWEKDFKQLQGGFDAFDQYKGHLNESAHMLIGCLKLYDSLDIILSRLYVYAFLKSDENQRADKYQQMGGRIRALNSQFGAATSFIDPEILSIPGDRLQSFLNSTPELDIYRFYIENLVRQQEHVLSPREEELLALAGPTTSAPHNIFSMLDNADMTYGTTIDEDGNEIELTKERYYKLLESKDREVRRRANQTYNEAYIKVQNTLAATLGASAQQDWFYTQARGFKSTLERKLFANNIPTEVFQNLIKAVDDNLEPLHKWTALRKKVLGYDTLYTYDLSVPLVPESKSEYKWEEAKEIVLEGVKPLGERYYNDFKTALNSRWIDVFETKGKASGAYQWGAYGTHPFVLMNYNRTMNAVFTLAHEMGHAMNFYYSGQKEPNLYSGQYTFTAEVASTANEAVLMKYMLEHVSDKKEKMALLNHYIEQIIGTFYTQVMFSEFELALHERIESGGAVSPQFLRETYRDIFQKYWGPELVIDSINDLGCMRIPHFYSSFYVYQYATCYAAAQMISQKIINEGDDYLPTYYQFLETGRSKYPVQILQEAGADMLTPEPINRTIKLFGELVDQMEKLLLEG
jgi:oligoendopeptidase F